MKNIFVAVIAMLIMLSLSACDNKNNSNISNKNNETPTSNKEQEEEVYSKATISLSYANEDLLARPNDFDEFIDYDSEYQVKVVFTTNAVVKDFKFLKLDFIDIDEKGNMDFNIKEIYVNNKLSPQRPIVIGMTFVGTIPDRGISYVDINGETKYYTIDMSGYDGSISLTELIK